MSENRVPGKCALAAVGILILIALYGAPPARASSVPSGPGSGLFSGLHAAKNVRTAPHSTPIDTVAPAPVATAVPVEADFGSVPPVPGECPQGPGKHPHSGRPPPALFG